MKPMSGELTATNIYTPQGKDSFTFRSINRTLDGEKLDDMGPVTVTRVGGPVSSLS